MGKIPKVLIVLGLNATDACAAHVRKRASGSVAADSTFKIEANQLNSTLNQSRSIVRRKRKTGFAERMEVYSDGVFNVTVDDRDTVNLASRKEEDLSVAFMERERAEATRFGGRHTFDFASDAVLTALAAPVLSVLVGIALVCRSSDTVVGRILVFFGAQNLMNLYMKSMLSQVVVSHERGLAGIQAPFVVTGIQQLIGFVILVIGIVVSQLSPWPYKPRIITTWAEWRTVLVCLVCFCLNISLNNLSMCLLDLSTNLMIRSCAPLATLTLQLACSMFRVLRSKDVNPTSLVMVILGVACGTTVVLGKVHASATNPTAFQNLNLGVSVCLCSTLAASMELVLVQAIGDNKRLNALDTVLHMGLPASLCLLLPSFFCSHPVDWHGYGHLTDWEIVNIILEFKPAILHLIAFSGVFAVAYNFLLYSLVREFSPTMAAFASNANKVGAIVMATLFGLEALPRGTIRGVVLLGMLGNLICFIFYGTEESVSPPSCKPMCLTVPLRGTIVPPYRAMNEKTFADTPSYRAAIANVHEQESMREC